MRTEAKVRLQVEMVPAGERPGRSKSSRVIKAVMAARKRRQLPKDIERSWEIKTTYLLLGRKAGPLPKPRAEPAASPCCVPPAREAREGNGYCLRERKRQHGHCCRQVWASPRKTAQPAGPGLSGSMRTGALTNSSWSNAPIYWVIKPCYGNSPKSKEKVKQYS